MKHEFNDMPWHDAEILSILIDRRNPGKTDQIIIDVRWPNGNDSRIIFVDCYGLEATMNFGILAAESILDASSMEECHKIDDIKNKWMRIGVKIGQLKCFEIRTNSTDSILHIYALDYDHETLANAA